MIGATSGRSERVVGQSTTGRPLARSANARPVLAFTDASFHPGREHAAFGIVLEQTTDSLSIPIELRHKYRLEDSRLGTSGAGAVAISGLIRGVDPTSAELMGVLAALEILRASGVRQRVVVYCDNLAVVRWLQGGTEDCFETYSRYSRLVDAVRSASAGMDWRIAKIEGHAGLNGNEDADGLARERSRRESTGRRPR